MRRVFIILMLAALAASPCWAAEAEEAEAAPEAQPKGRIVAPRTTKPVGPIGRGVNGVRNIVLSPLELPVTLMGELQVRDNFMEAFLFGVGNGTGNFAVRAFAGVVELTTVVVPVRSMPLYDRRLGEPATLPDPWQ